MIQLGQISNHQTTHFISFSARHGIIRFHSMPLQHSCHQWHEHLHKLGNDGVTVTLKHLFSDLKGSHDSLQPGWVALGLDQHSPSLVSIAWYYLYCYFKEKSILKNLQLRGIDCSWIQEELSQTPETCTSNLGSHLLFAQGREGKFQRRQI